MVTDPVRPRGLRAAGLAGSWCFLMVMLTPGVATAHHSSALPDTDFRITVTGQPGPPGVTARVVEAGTRLELRNDSADNVEVLGYQREPYAELRPDGLYINVRSPAAHLNATIDGTTTVPDSASAAAIPVWHKASDVAVLRWHDHRADGLGQCPARFAGNRDVLVQDWWIPVRIGTTIHRLTGSVHWFAGPRTSGWLAGSLLASGALVALGVAAGSRRYPVAVMAVVAGAVLVIDTIGRSIVISDTADHWSRVLMPAQWWQLIAGLCTVTAGGYALARRPAADLAVGLAGLFMALLTALTRWGSLIHPVTPTPWPGDAARVVTVTTLAVGSALAILAAGRIRFGGTRPSGRRGGLAHGHPERSLVRLPGAGSAPGPTGPARPRRPRRGRPTGTP